VLYGRAFDALKAANYPEAIAGMSGFVAQFPTHPLADNAQYWLGQTYYVTRDYAKAIEAFASVGSRSPDSSKAPDALLKKGLSELSLGRNDAARASFNEVLRRYPQNDVVRTAREQLGRLR
jgi:tol-pal system protein YbgF